MNKIIAFTILIGLLSASIHGNPEKEERKKFVKNFANEICTKFDCSKLYIFVEDKLDPSIHVIPAKYYIPHHYPGTTISTTNFYELSDYLVLIMNSYNVCVYTSLTFNRYVVDQNSDNDCSSSFRKTNTKYITPHCGY